MHIKLDVVLFPWMPELKLFWKKLLVFHPSDLLHSDSFFHLISIYPVSGELFAGPAVAFGAAEVWLVPVLKADVLNTVCVELWSGNCSGRVGVKARVWCILGVGQRSPCALWAPMERPLWPWPVPRALSSCAWFDLGFCGGCFPLNLNLPLQQSS